MFKGLGSLGTLASLMSNPQKIKDEVDRLQQHIGQITTEGDAGGGMVKVRANGKQEILSCVVSEELLRLNDREMLEDLIRAAVNQALERAREQAAGETAKMMTSFGLPPGISLPGLLPGS